MMADETQNMNDVTDEHEVAPQVKPLFPLPDLRQDATDDEEARSREEFTTVYDVIDQMEQSLDQAKGALFAPGLIKVDRDEFADHLATLKKMLPVQARTRVRVDARGRAPPGERPDAGQRHRGLGAEPRRRHDPRAEEQAQFLAGQENVTALAKQKAREIMDQAQAKADRLTRGADQYCTTVMEGLQQQITKLDHDVKAGLNVLYDRQHTAAQNMNRPQTTTEE